MYLQREVSAILIKLAKVFPVVCVIGPRQSGKTTLVKNVFENKLYFNLESYDIRNEISQDPNKFLLQNKNGMILDEIQRLPEILSYIQVIVDERKQMGQFILTGSNQFEYMNNISQSLAGRIAIIKLLPFSLNEVYSGENLKANEIILKGLYPAIFDRKIEPEDYYPSYINTYLERDVRMIKQIQDLSLFYKFLRLCAGRVGQILNKNSLAKECGIYHTTIEKWLSVLEASFIIFRLQPYYKNVKKRYIKSPKLYFFDTGLVSNLLTINSTDQLQSHYLKGEIFENFVISEFMKYQFNRGRRNNYFYYRDNNRNEVDLIIDTGYGPVPVEIKSGKKVKDDFFKGLTFFRKISNLHKFGGLIYGGQQNYSTNDIRIKSYGNVYQMYEELTGRENWKSITNGDPHE